MAFCFSGSCYELTSVLFLCFSCFIPLLFVANKFFFPLSLSHVISSLFRRRVDG